MHSRLDVAFAKFVRVKFYPFIFQALESISSAFFGAKKSLAHFLQLKRAKQKFRNNKGKHTIKKGGNTLEFQSAIYCISKMKGGNATSQSFIVLLSFIPHNCIGESS